MVAVRTPTDYVALAADDAAGTADWFVVDFIGPMAWAMTDEELRDSLSRAEVLRSVLTAAEAEVFAELERRSSPHDAETDLRRAQRVSSRTARRRATTARHVAVHEPTRAALTDGTVTSEHAAALSDAEAEHAGAAGELLEAATRQGPELFRETVRRHVRDRDGDDGASTATKQFRRRSGKVFTNDEDMAATDINQDLTLVKTTGRQMLADAYADMAAASLAAGAKGASAAPAARLLLVVDYNAVTGALTGRLPNGTSLSPATVRRVACDAAVIPAVFDGPGQPLDIGAELRLVTPGQRAALEARDGGCRGCGAHPAFCQAHHIIHWADFGPTNIANLVLLCSTCHHLVHEGDHVVDKLPSGELALKRKTVPKGDPMSDTVDDYAAGLDMRWPKSAREVDSDTAQATALIGDDEYWWDTPEDHESGHCCQRQSASEDDDVNPASITDLW